MPSGSKLYFVQDGRVPSLGPIGSSTASEQICATDKTVLHEIMVQEPTISNLSSGFKVGYRSTIAVTRLGRQ